MQILGFNLMLQTSTNTTRARPVSIMGDKHMTYIESTIPFRPKIASFNED